jgi:hypothetical protein
LLSSSSELLSSRKESQAEETQLSTSQSLLGPRSLNFDKLNKFQKEDILAFVYLALFRVLLNLQGYLSAPDSKNPVRLLYQVIPH